MYTEGVPKIREVKLSKVKQREEKKRETIIKTTTTVIHSFIQALRAREKTHSVFPLKKAHPKVRLVNIQY